ncbi:MAG: acetate--CoA ligase family protein [Peptococcaceae bacterium]|nr:acetate--CoA ligase family protein [Peptococcaceae bacterium]
MVMPDSIDIRPLFFPASIVLVGASSDFTKLSGRPLRFLLERGYQGRIYPVNPKYTSIGHLKCYSSLDGLPEAPDLAIIALPAEAVTAALTACGRRGVKAAVIFSAGFGETGPHGRQLEEDLKNIALKYRMAVCGPNCAGLLNLPDRVVATFNAAMEKAVLKPGEMTFVSQSGALGTYMFAAAQDAGIGFNYWVSTGNETVLGFTDFVAYFLADDRTGAIMGYLEDARDGESLQRCAELALARGKPILLLKVGGSTAGAKAAASHTGALAGSDQVYDAVFNQWGVLRARSIEELFDLATVCAGRSRPAGREVAILSISGGAGILMADKSEEAGLHLTSLAPATTAALRQVLPPYASLDNPVDVTAELMARPELLRKSMEVVLCDPAVDNLLIFLGLQLHSGVRLARDIVEIALTTAKPVVVSWVAPPPGAVDILRENRVPVFSDPTRAIKAVAGLVQFNERRARYLAGRDLPAGPQLTMEAGKTGRLDIARGIISRVRQEGRTALMETEAKELLAAYGIPVPRGQTARSGGEAAEIARNLGWPVVLKVVSPDVLHKTEAGGVYVGARDEAEVRKAYEAIMARVRADYPQARVRGVLVEEMAPAGTEVIVGLKQDHRFGPVLTFGLGGIFVEVFGDATLRLPPLAEEEAWRMISEIKGYPLLAGYRGQKKRDLAALVQVLGRMSDFAQDWRDQLAECELNPLVALEEGRGVKAVDALVVLTQL